MTADDDESPRKPRTRVHYRRARSWREFMGHSRYSPDTRKRDTHRPRMMVVLDFLADDTQLRRIAANRAGLGVHIYTTED